MFYIFYLNKILLITFNLIFKSFKLDFIESKNTIRH